jgi:hypothetical protein
VTGPLSGGLEQLSVFKAFVFTFTDGCFSGHASEVIRYFVFHDADQPRAFRAATLKVFIGFNGGEKRFLDDVFGGGLIPQSKDGVLEEVVAMLVEPGGAIGRFNGGLFFHPQITQILFV